jgi:phage baseplate assembly protein W
MSTLNRTKKFRVTDFELAKQDLYNNLHIRQGEKLMNPGFGTIIWSLLFEPFTPEVKDAMTKDLQRIINYDPRIVADNIVVTQFDYGIQIQIDLRYIVNNHLDTMLVQFDRQK